MRQPDVLTAFAALWSGRDLEDWKRWLRWRLISSRASLLTDELVAENFDFYGRTLSGTEEIRERWKRGVGMVESLMGDTVGKLYVERHFPPGAKARMDELVANLREAYRVSINDLEWMTPETRARALAKLDKFTPKIGYPVRWRDYSALVIDRDDLYGNALRGQVVETDRELAKLGGPVDRDEWFMTPQTVNAYYNPGMNEIVFPAAILQPPFFDAEADDAANYGGIGAVIGHEIGHGFDDQGAKYDGDGNLVDWWTDSDRTEFGSRTDALIAQYEDFVPRQLSAGQHVNGAFTVGENIGDLGGLSIALLAYQLSLDGKEAPVIDGLTGVQRVFFGWAQVWRTKSRDAEAIRRLATDPHSPPEFRCNGVIRNIDAYYDAFEVSESDETVPGAASAGCGSGTSAQVSHVRGRVWRAGKPQDDFEFASISDYLVEKDTLVWADIYDPDHASLTDLAQELGLNHWAVEDAVADAERTKATVYKTHTFFTVYAVSATDSTDETESALSLHRISGFVLPQGLITVRLSPVSSPIDAVSQRFDELGGQEYGVGSLVHGLLDVVVDGHFTAVQCLDDAVESIEDDLFADANPQSGLQRRTFRLRKDLVELRRVRAPDAGGGQRNPAPPSRRQDGAGTRSPLRRPVRPRAARLGVDRVVARHGVNGFRDQPEPAGRPAEHRDEEADRMGGHHRRADGDHRLLRPERELPRHPDLRRLRHQQRTDRGAGRRALRQLQTARLAVALRPASPGRRRVGCRCRRSSSRRPGRRCRSCRRTTARWPR